MDGENLYLKKIIREKERQLGTFNDSFFGWYTKNHGAWVLREIEKEKNIVSREREEIFLFVDEKRRCRAEKAENEHPI